MFTWLWNKFLGFFDWLWESAIKPIWTVVHSFFLAIVGVILFLVAFVQTATQWVLEMVQTVVGAIATMMGQSQAVPDFSASSGIMADINVFVPLREFFALLSVTLVLLGAMLVIRFAKWLREIFLP